MTDLRRVDQDPILANIPTIYTNYHERPLLCFWELTQAQRDFVKREHDWANLEEEIFIPYKGWVYCLSEFMRVSKHAPDWLQAWDGYLNDTFFSGVVVRYCEDDNFDQCIQIGTFVG